MSDDPFITVGIDGQAPRLEVHRFIKDKFQFSLYIQALQIMQIEEGSGSKVKETEPDSHFQIGGIHGVPYIKWTGDSRTDIVIPGVELGYCTHGNNLFPTWHRPYVALYEQTVQRHAAEIAKQYQSSVWTNAARDLRVPYWDWANPDTAIPPSEFIDDQEVRIMTPQGSKWVKNPLLRYKFQTPLEYDKRGQHYKFTETFRDAKDLKTFKDHFNPKNVDQLRESVLKLFDPTKTSTWDTFSNHGPKDDYSDNSLETVHDTIHDLVGGFMGDPARAGFDPIFYLHHCNVDRLLALWQSRYPKVWVSPGNSRNGTATIPALAPVDVNTGLTPFWKSKSDLFSSTLVQAYKSFGYDYPELRSNEIDPSDPESVKKGVLKLVGGLYGKFDPHIREYLPHDNHHVVKTIKSQITMIDDVESAIDRLLLAFTAHVELKPSETEIFKPYSLEYFEWTTRVRVKHYALGESFGVYFYLDPPSGASSDDELYDSFVGAFYTFVNTKADSCENCQSQAESIDQGNIYLNSAIAERSGVKSFRPEKLLPYLSSKLSWKVKKLNGEEVPLDQVPSLEVVLHHIPVTLEPGSTRPDRGNITKYPILNSGF